MEVKSCLDSRFVEVKTRIDYSSHLSLEPDKVTANETKSEHNGYVFHSENGNLQLHVKNNSISLHSLNSTYTTSGDYIPCVLNAFQKLTELDNALKINRIGVRYLNKIKLPTKDLNFADYLNWPPSTPPILYGKIISYFMQITCPSEIDPTFLINLMQMCEVEVEEQSQKVLPIVLSIDVSKIIFENYKYSDVSDSIHAIKNEANRIFQDVLKDKAKELFS